MDPYAFVTAAYLALSAAMIVAGLGMLAVGVRGLRSSPLLPRSRARWIRRLIRRKVVPEDHDTPSAALDELFQTVNAQQALGRISGSVAFVLAAVSSILLLLLIPPEPRITSALIIMIAPLGVALMIAFSSWMRLISRRYGTANIDGRGAAGATSNHSLLGRLLPLTTLVVTIALIALSAADIVGWPATDAYLRKQQLAVLAIPWLVWMAPAATALIFALEVVLLRLMSSHTFHFTSDPLLNARAEQELTGRFRAAAFFGGSCAGWMAMGQPVLLSSDFPFSLLGLGLGMLCAMANYAGMIASQPDFSPVASPQVLA